MTQKELYESLKNNPLSLPVYFAQDTLKKGEDFIVFAQTGNTGNYADNSLYGVFNKVQISLYCQNIDDLNKTIIYLQKLLNVPADTISNEDIYYVAFFNKEVMVDDWSIEK